MLAFQKRKLLALKSIDSDWCIRCGAEKQIQEEQAKGIPRERIAVGGFSQGGHIALKSMFKAQQPLAACVALSTWLEPGFNGEVRSY